MQTTGATFQTKSAKLYVLVLDYLIDPAFKKINRLFVLSFKNGDREILLINIKCY